MTIMLYQKIWPGVFILIVVILFIVHLFMNTYYQIDDKLLHIKSGFIYRNTIEIGSITKINRTQSIFSAPSLSFDRVEIHYNKFDTVVISPENKEEFFTELKRINSNIEINS